MINMEKTKAKKLLDWKQDLHQYEIEERDGGYYVMDIITYGLGFTCISSRAILTFSKSELIEMLDKFASVRDDLNGADKE